jgi:trehalose/maltose transport system substrate-binding protein
MKTKRIFWVLIALLIVGALILSACQPAEETEAPDEPAEPVTVRAFVGNVGQELELSKDAAERYMAANPDVTVEVVDTPDFVEDRLGVYLQLFEAQSPEGDVFQIDVIWPGDLAAHFVDLNDYGAGAVSGDHFPAIVQNNTVDGALVGIPWFTDAGLLYFRSDLLEKYGYAAGPTTWDELEEMAATIQAGERDAGNADFWGFVWQGNAYEGLTCDALEWVYSNGGGTIVSPDKKITVNNPAAIAAVERAADWVGTISPPGVTGFGEEDARGVWQAGNAAFMRNWPYAYSLGQADDSAIKDLFDVSPLPAGDAGKGAATLGGWQLAVSKYSANPEVAADVALFMASADEQKIRAIEGSFNPTVMSLYEDADVLEATPFFGSLYDVFINAVARPSTATAPQYAETSRIFFTGVHDVLTGASDAATAFEGMELDLSDLLGYEVGEPMAMAEPKEMVQPKVCFITDLAGVDDRSFNALGWKGVNDAVDAGYALPDPILLESDAVEDYQPNIEACLTEGATHIVTSGFAIMEAVGIAAAENPDVKWTFIDGGGFGLDNVRELVYQTDEPSFAAGYLAAGVTKTGIIGTYGGANYPTVAIFMDGMARGVEYYNEMKGTDVQVIGWSIADQDGQFTGSFTDMALARTTCEGILDEGADIMLPVGGAINLPCGDAIIARGIDAALIGVDADAALAMPETYKDLWLITIEKGIDIQVTRSIKADAEGTWTPGGTVGNAANDAVGLSPLNAWEDKVSDELKAEVDALFEDIKAGKVDAAVFDVE